MIKISMNRFNFIKLPIKCILNLAAIPRHEVLQVYQDSIQVLKAAVTSIILPRFQCK